MPATNAPPQLEVQTFEFSKEIDVAAPIQITFESVLAEMGPEWSMPEGAPFPFKLEPWPGGRWIRDLGNNAGHFWGQVQVIKPPTLLEICGPMLLSYPANNHLQYRLTAQGESATRLKLTHRAFGLMPRGFLQQTETGWAHGLRQIAEKAAARARKQSR